MSEESKNVANMGNNINSTSESDIDPDILINDEDEDDSEVIFIDGDSYQDDENDDDNYGEDDKLDTKQKRKHGLDSLDREFSRSVANNRSPSLSPDLSPNNRNTNSNDNSDDDTEANDNDENDEKAWEFGTNKNHNKEGLFQDAEEVEEVDEDDLVANQGNSEEIESKAVSDNKSGSAEFLSFFKKGGHYNPRSIGVIALLGGFILAVVFSMNSSKPETKQAKLDAPLPEQSKMAETVVDTNELEPVTTKYFPEERPIDPALPTVTIPPVVAPAVVEAVKSEKPVEAEESKEFGIELRAGTQAALKTINPSKQETNENGAEVSLDGLSIPMILLEPFRSGISTLVKAQVTADVINSKGEIVIRANSRVQVPFERFEIDGRVMNDSDQPAQLFLPNGKKLNIKGTVKGLDGFAGIKGKVRKLSKGNVFARMGKTVGRVGARVVGVTTGGFAGRGLEDTINESVDQNTGFIPTGRIVEVLPGTRFTFTASQL